jgi:hypothetical protein
MFTVEILSINQRDCYVSVSSHQEEEFLWFGFWAINKRKFNEWAPNGFSMEFL